MEEDVLIPESRTVRVALDQRKLFLAKDLLAALRKARSSGLVADTKTIASLEERWEREFAEYTKLLKSAQGEFRSGDLSRAVVLYEQTLELAEDSLDARNALSRCIPEPPSALRCTVGAAAVHLDWRPSPAAGKVEYLVVWHGDHAPQSPTDGSGTATAKVAFWEDQTLRAGERRFYAVFAQRWGACSTAAVGTEVLGTFEVRAAKAVADPKGIRGFWEGLAPKAKALVTRTTVGKSGSSSSRTIASTSTGFLDEAVGLGNEYEYRVAVEYSFDGRRRVTNGVTVRALLEFPPEPVTALQISAINFNQLRISWETPKHGEVHLFALDEPPRASPGTYLDVQVLANWNRYRVQHSENSARWSRMMGKSRFLTVVTTVGERAVMGACFFDVEDVTEIAAEHLQGAIQLLWRWPAECGSALVAWRHDSFPALPGDAVSKQEITLGSYRLAGGFRLLNPEPKPYYFTIFTGVLVGGSMHYGAGSSDESRVLVLAARRLPVTYFVTKSLLRNKYQLRITCEEQGTALPELVLISNSSGVQPRDAEQGNVILRITNAVSPFRQTFQMPRAGYLRLFISQTSLSDQYQIVDPPPSQLDRTQ